MASLHYRFLIFVLYVATIPVLGQDGGGSCAAPRTGSLNFCADKVQVLLQVTSLNETVSAVPVQATRQTPVTSGGGGGGPTPSRRPPQSARAKFQVEQRHFRQQLEAMRQLRRQFSTVPPHFHRDIEYYDRELDEYDDYVILHREKDFDYCSQDGRVRSGAQYLIQVDSGVRANDYEVFPGVGVYRFHTTPLRWEDARRQCEAEDAHLLVVNSQEEANVTVSMFSRCRQLQQQQLNDYAYVGARQTTVDGDFLTIEGEKVDASGYSAWEFGHPDPSPSRNVKCVSVNREGLLVDLDCHLRLAYFCEYDGI